MAVFVNVPAANKTHTARLAITAEVGLYLMLALLSLMLHVAQLGHAPLNDTEAREALAALGPVKADLPVEAPVSRSPLTFALNVIMFTFVGQGEAAARLPVALGGVLLTLSPVLWRRYLNPLPPLVVSLLLTVSPVVLLASRTMSPVVWTMLLAVVAPWCVLRFVETRQRVWALAAASSVGAMVFLVDPAGLLTLAALVFGVGFAWLTEDDPEVDIPAKIREVTRVWPWRDSLITAGLVILLVGTVFLWLPSGLTAVGNVLWQGARGFTTHPVDALIAFPVWVSLRYEFGLVLFGLFASYRAIREGGFFERVLTGWFLMSLMWSLVYVGADASYALWFTLPLSALVGLSVTNWLTERPGVIWQVPGWGMPLHALVTLALWLAVGLSIVILGKLLLVDLPSSVTGLDALLRTLLQGVYSRNADPGDVVSVGDTLVFVSVLGNIQLRLLVTILVTLLVAVLFFLVGSLWGARTSWRGLALGTLAFFLLFGMGLGGREALGPPGDPRQLWTPDPVTDDVFELRATLREMSLRENGIVNLIDITAMVPPDGALAWALRDYPNAVFVNGVGPEIESAAVVMPWIVPQPVMGADYVGKDLVLRQRWDLDSLSWRDTLMWLYRSDAQIDPTPQDTLMVWVRKDVYGVERVTED